MKIAILACDVIKDELEYLLKDDADFTERKYLDFALHEDPPLMRQTLIEEITVLLANNDAVLLGYANCQSLDGIEGLFDKPVVKLPGCDCIDALLGPEEYTNEKKICTGTWFNSPGWAKMGTEGLIREMKLDCIEDIDPMYFLSMLFDSYERVLFVDSGVGDRVECEAKSRHFADQFNLRHDCRTCDLRYFEATIQKIKDATHAYLESCA